MSVRFRLFIAFALLCAAGESHGASRPDPAAARASRLAPAFARQTPFVIRHFEPFIGGRWIGNAIAYGPHRDGQRPGGPSPTRAELRQDLLLMSKHWSLLRLYGSVGPPDSILAIIREDRLEMRVMLGIWIEPEARQDSAGNIVERFPEAGAANRLEIEAAIRLAAAYPEIIIAVSVGNEIQVSWSSHRVRTPVLVNCVREVRARTGLPVTTADDFHYWNRPESRTVAREVDFIVTHIHPLWNGRTLEDAADWTRRSFAEVRACHPGRAVVIGETGWATRKLDQGEQGRLIQGRPGEEEQAVFCDALTAWARSDSVATFLFEAFDENWKGGPDPGDVEKHWGIFRADRTPKKALDRLE
jgi:exo-beta-1,3-glucanase (GH17 family)